jgi:hypothetical protein
MKLEIEDPKIRDMYQFLRISAKTNKGGVSGGEMFGEMAIVQAEEGWRKLSEAIGQADSLQGCEAAIVQYLKLSDACKETNIGLTV